MYFSVISLDASFSHSLCLRTQSSHWEGFFPHSESEFMVCSLPLLPTSLPCTRNDCTEWFKRSQDDRDFPLVLKEYFTLWLALIMSPPLSVHMLWYLTLACKAQYLEPAQRKEPAERDSISASLRVHVATKCDWWRVATLTNSLATSQGPLLSLSSRVVFGLFGLVFKQNQARFGKRPVQQKPQEPGERGKHHTSQCSLNSVGIKAFQTLGDKISLIELYWTLLSSQFRSGIIAIFRSWF